MCTEEIPRARQKFHSLSRTFAHEARNVYKKHLFFQNIDFTYYMVYANSGNSGKPGKIREMRFSY